jgi:hypothetical protein
MTPAKSKRSEAPALAGTDETAAEKAASCKKGKGKEKPAVVAEGGKEAIESEEEELKSASEEELDDDQVGEFTGVLSPN